VSWRIPAALAVLALLAWVGFEIGRAGSEIQVARNASPNTMLNGRVSSKRIDGRAWSLDYDTVTMTPDGSQATIGHVRDGRLHRTGKPDVIIQAEGVTVNTVTNDLAITGPVTFTEQEGPGRTRTFTTKGAHYSGGTHEMDLDHSATITEGDAKIVVTNAVVNFRTGEVRLGRIEGTKTGSGKS
jgi:lipopolysaccharide export system protein LptC